MQVQRITNESYKPNFKSLKILYPDLWNGERLNELVHNLEIQKFVKYWHDQGVNITATPEEPLGIGLSAYNKPHRFTVAILYCMGGVNCFNAAEAISKIKQETQEKIENLPLLQQAQEFVDNFNKALAESKNQTTIWKV